MAIIAFWSKEKRETGQTLSQIALTTHMAIEHNYKILNISTSFNDNTMEDAYWNNQKQMELLKKITNTNNQIGMESGIEGLIKVLNSNKTSNNIVSSYAKVVFKDRLDVLCAPKTTSFNEYTRICGSYLNIVQAANRNYDLVFIDISKSMPEEQVKKILEIADIIVVNITQKLRILDDYIKLKEENNFFKKNNILINIGRYDRFSKYNIKNITRYTKQKRDVLATLYNTLFFESCSESTVANYFIGLRSIKDTEDRNFLFIEQLQKNIKEIIYKLQELQIRI